MKPSASPCLLIGMISSISSLILIILGINIITIITTIIIVILRHKLQHAFYLPSNRNKRSDVEGHRTKCVQDWHSNNRKDGEEDKSARFFLMIEEPAPQTISVKVILWGFECQEALKTITSWSWSAWEWCWSRSSTVPPRWCWLRFGTPAFLSW